MALTKTLGGSGGGGVSDGDKGDVVVSGSGTVWTIDNNVALGGSPTTTTQAAGDNSTKIATTAYVDTAVAAVSSGGTGRFWDVTAIPTDASVQTARTIDFSDATQAATVLSGGTWANQGSATAAIQRQRLFMTTPTGSAAHNKRVFFPASTYQLPTNPWCVQVPTTLYGTINFNHAGIYIKNTANGKGYACGFQARSGIYQLSVTKMTTETSAASDLLAGNVGFAAGVLAVTYDGTTFKFWASPDGADWPPSPNTSEAASTHIGSGGTYQFGFFVDTFAAVQSAGAFNNSVILNQATPVPHGQFV